ncbi:hypothetical protein HYU13_04980 [Candidatus Woesearchaeota archaeon]|nr:hypothetical protein [Candidatus Woesearchaeota archaeon]
MEESFESALDEVKRAEHLYYVSLKYTRTVDVIKSTLERLSNALEFMFITLLLYAKKKKKVKEIPESPILKVKELEKGNWFPEMDVNSHIQLYYLMRKVLRSPFGRLEEYRRHVTMVAKTDEGEKRIDIDVCGEYYQKVFEFLKLVKAQIQQ